MIRDQSYCFIGIFTIYFFFFLHPLLHTFASPTRSLCRSDQRDALLELPKDFQTSWNKSDDCCDWYGVICDAISGEVISLELSSYNTSTNISFISSSGLFKLKHLRELGIFGYNLQGLGLQGEIPSSIGNLSHLTQLYIQFGNLQGEIPSSIGNLSHLTHLHISFCNLQGEIPSSIGNLSHLTSLDLSRNYLRGNIPTSFTNFTKLSELDLSRNQLTGGDIVIANLTSLSRVNLSSNHFKSLMSVDLSGLTNLEYFEASKNSFSGPFPSSLLTIPSLVKIVLSQNQFEGPIDFGNISSLSKLVNLSELDLSHNNFGGGVPKSLSKLVNLWSLDLSFNKLEGQIPHCLWRSSNLNTMDLSHNSFNFGKSVEIADGVSLQNFYLRSNSLQGPIPQWICKLRELRDIDFSNNHLTGSIPQCLKNYSFNKFNLRNNSLSGFLPDFCIDGFQLRSLDVSRNNLVGKLPKSLINCTSMEFLNVKGNKIKDTFPFWLGSLLSLKILVLRSNAFYGPVYNPSPYLGFPHMRIIDISNNNFTGSLPQDYFASWHEMSLVWDDSNFYSGSRISEPTYMEDSMDFVYKGVNTYFVEIFGAFKVIDFSENQFFGHIPRSIGMLSQLRILNLSGNAFIGNIPTSLANITKLETLDLSRNNLSGQIPQGLGNLSFLSYVNFSHNHLEGLVPQSTQFGSQNCSSFMGNPGLYGLEKICRERHHVHVPTSQQPEESLSEAEEPVLNWIAAAIAFGPGVFCGLVIGHIFTSYKHEWFIISR